MLYKWNLSYSINISGVKYINGSRKNVNVDIQELKIDFSIQKNSFADTMVNNANFTIYNLAPETRALLRKASSETATQLKLIFNVGYADEQSYEICNIDVYECQSQQSGSDYVTEIRCGAGFNSFFQATSQTTLSDGSSLYDVGKKLADNMGLTVDANGLDTSSYGEDVSLYGNSYTLTKDFIGGGFFIDGDKISFLAKNQYKKDVVTVITADSGLLNIPEDMIGLIPVSMIFDPSIKINRLVQLKMTDSNNRDNNNFYKVVGIVHTGTITKTGADSGTRTTTLELYHPKNNERLTGV
jgi:hypothetical protein